MNRYILLFVVLFIIVLPQASFSQRKPNPDSLRHIMLLKRTDSIHKKKIDSIQKRKADTTFKKKIDTSFKKRSDTLRKVLKDSAALKRAAARAAARKDSLIQAARKDSLHKAARKDSLLQAALRDSIRKDSLALLPPPLDSAKLKSTDSLNKAIAYRDSVIQAARADSIRNAKKDTVAAIKTETTIKESRSAPPNLPLIVAIGIAILMISFFSGIEIAFVSASKLSVELKKKQGSYSGRIWSAYMDKPARFIGTMLIIFNLLLVTYGLLWSNVLESFWHLLGIHNPYIKITVETLLSATFLLVFEFIFKAYFRAKNDTILRSGLITFIVQFFYSIFASIATVFVDMAEWILKYIFNVKIHDKKEVFSKIDLENFIQQNKTYDIQESTEMNNELFENVLSLSEIKVRTCLIPRKEIEGVDIMTSIEEVKKKFMDTKLSKLIVYEGNIDNVMGYIHQLDMFKRPQIIRSILLPIPAIPESMSASDLITKFSKERKSIAWVVDEFGGTAGIITMEDILEEIFGDIRDEYDTTEEFVEKQIATNEYLFSGRLELDYITEKYKLPFRHDEETETLSGYIISQHETIPKQKDRIIIDDYEFDILSVSETRIETVKLKVLR